MKRFLRRFFRLASVSVLLLIAGIGYCNWRVSSVAKDRVYSETDAIPKRRVGLLLGTSKYGSGGSINLYYKYRIDAAAQLMRSGKIEYIVASGDNGKDWYNEPETMRQDLIAAGVDSTRIFLDYAGFRTFDSMIRLREIFSQHSATVISQRFHNERAIYIARREGIDAIGFQRCRRPRGSRHEDRAAGKAGACQGVRRLHHRHEAEVSGSESGDPLSAPGTTFSSYDPHLPQHFAYDASRQCRVEQ